MNSSAIELEIPILEDSGEQILRIPPALRLSGSHVRLRRNSEDGPITLTQMLDNDGVEERKRRLQELFAAIDVAREAGETFEIERNFCPPREVDI